MVGGYSKQQTLCPGPLPLVSYGEGALVLALWSERLSVGSGFYSGAGSSSAGCWQGWAQWPLERVILGLEKVINRPDLW